jgi:hypothetical protein
MLRNALLKNIILRSCDTDWVKGEKYKAEEQALKTSGFCLI